MISSAASIMEDFNPRTPCGVRPVVSALIVSGILFQSTHPVRGATLKPDSAVAQIRFQSTHPVRGATFVPGLNVFSHLYFNPRTPCGVRPWIECDGGAIWLFQSTYPVRGATSVILAVNSTSIISIHVPRAGCDGKFDDFNPLNLHKRYKRVLDRPKSTSEQGKNKAKLAYIHVFTVFWGGAKVPELSARFYFAPNTVRLSARPWRHSPLWHRNARCGCDTYPQGSKSADCLRIHP